MSFRIARNFKCDPFNFNSVDWYEFLWQYERTAQEIERLNQEQAGGGNNDLMNIIGGGGP